MTKTFVLVIGHRWRARKTFGGVFRPIYYIVGRRQKWSWECGQSFFLDFLKCGGSKSPLDSLLVAGIDMTDPDVVTSAIDDFASCVAEFKKIYEKNN